MAKYFAFVRRLETAILIGFGLLFSLPASSACYFNSAANIPATINVGTNGALYSFDSTSAWYQFYTGGFTAADLATVLGLANATTVLATCIDGATIAVSSTLPSNGDKYLWVLDDLVKLYAYGQNASASTFWNFPLNGATSVSHSVTDSTITPATLLGGNGATSGSRAGVDLVYHENASGSSNWPGGTVISIAIDGTEVVQINFQPFAIEVRGCSVNSYDADVDLGQAHTNVFKTVGSTSNTTPFSIAMSCASAAVNPKLVFEGVTVANDPTVLANDGSASGLGVQLLNGASVITPGENLALSNQGIGISTSYTFNSRLYQIEDIVNAGSVDATVTFSIEYE